MSASDEKRYLGIVVDENGSRTETLPFAEYRDPLSGGGRPIKTTPDDKVDLSFIDIPTGEIVYTASEALSAGDLVNIYDEGGVKRVRKADASALDKTARGFVTENVSLGETVGVRVTGECQQTVSGGAGPDLFLSGATPGKASGVFDSEWVIWQVVGFRGPTTSSFVFQPMVPVIYNRPE